VLAEFQVRDRVRPQTRTTIAALKKMNIDIILLTDDTESAAATVAQELGIEKVHGGLLPADKHAIVQRLQLSGRHVLMAGDGINDAPALAAADVGIAMGSGTDIAISSSGITLLHGDISGILKSIRLGRATMRNIKQNLWFAFGYNFLGVPVAAGILYPFTGTLLSPVIAGAAMTLSSVSVIANSLRLNSAKLTANR
jgi:Cu+-exporting ATPase